MRFMSIVTAPPQHYGKPTPALMEAIQKLSEREIAAGRMVGTGGLMPLDQGTRVAVKNGQIVVHDGPFSETKEVIGGYAIFELNNLDEARVLAVEFVQLHTDHMPGWEGTCEVRELFTTDCD